MNGTGYFITIITIVIILWIYYIQFYRGVYHKEFLDDIIDIFKTGDIILFKAFNNFNSVWHGGYFGHIGIVYVQDGIPMLFEANGIDFEYTKEHHNKNGIFLTPVRERIQKYKGRCFLKQLNKNIPDSIQKEFKEFIDFCQKEMFYDYSVLQSLLCKYFGLCTLGLNTNCAEIVYLSLIKLQLLKLENYDNKIFHYLNHMAGLKTLENDYEYHDLIEVIDYPFAK